MKPQAMKFAFLLCGAAVTAAAQTPAAAPTAAPAASKAVGHWTGNIHMGPNEVPMIIDLAKNAAGAWVGTFGVAGSTQTGIPLADINVAEANVKFSIDVGDRATFDGKLSAEGNAIAGTASNSQGSVGFDLARSGEAKVDLPAPSTALPKEFEGRWEGAIAMGAQSLRLAIKLSTGADGKAAAALTSIDQGGQEFPATSVAVNGKEITIEVRPIGGSYKGTLGATGEIAGAFTQGGNNLALTLKKAP